MVFDYQCVTSDRVASSRKTGKRLRLYVLTRYQYLLTLFSGRITPGGVGGLQILETLTINELYQCYPPSPTRARPRHRAPKNQTKSLVMPVGLFV